MNLKNDQNMHLDERKKIIFKILINNYKQNRYI